MTKIIAGVCCLLLSVVLMYVLSYLMFYVKPEDGFWAMPTVMLLFASIIVGFGVSVTLIVTGISGE